MASVDATLAPAPAWSYRDATQALVQRRDTLLARRRVELGAVPADVERLYARRAGRSAAGATAFVGACWLVLLAGWRALGNTDFVPTLTDSLLATLALMPIAYVAAWAIAPRVLARRLAAALRPSHDVIADVARFDRRTTAGLAADFVDALERRSVSWTMIGLAVIVPISLHLVAALVMRVNQYTPLAERFDWWISTSVLVVTPAHVVLALLCRKFARDLRAWSAFDPIKRPMSGWAAYGWTCVAGLVPGAILFMVPPVLVAVTGVAFIPVLFSVMRHRIINERRLLEAHWPRATA
jgi:hypothetical protein